MRVLLSTRFALLTMTALAAERPANSDERPAYRLFTAEGSPVSFGKMLYELAAAG